MQPHLKTHFTAIDCGLVFAALLVILGGVYLTPSDVRGLLGNSVQLAFVVCVVAVPSALALAFAVSKYDIPGKRFWDACMLMLLFLPLYIQLASWEAGFGRGGWYSNLIDKKLNNPPLEGFRGTVWVHAVAAIPWLFWLFRMAIASVSRSYEEAASLDAPQSKIMRHITLPFVWPMIFAASFYVSIVSMTEITITDRYQYRSYAEVLYNEYVLNSNLAALPLSMGAVSALIVAVGVLGILMCKLVLPRLVHATVAGSTSLRTSRPAVTATVFAVVAIAIGTLLFLPIANLLYQAGIEVVANDAGDRVRRWTMHKLWLTLSSSPSRYSEELAWTAILAQISTLTAVGFATLATWWAQRQRAVGYVNSAVSLLCFVMPGTLVGFAIIWIFRVAPPSIGWLYNDTILAPCLAMTIKCFPFAYLIMWYGVRAIPDSLFEAAEADGATSFGVLRNITLPLLRPSLICAVVICLAVSVGELSASVLVMPPGVTTVATQIFTLVHYGADDQLAGLCLCCVVLFGVLAVAGNQAINVLAGKRAG